jgi:hypothetical protein
MTTQYSTRLVWGRSDAMERELSQSKARALLRQLEEMQFCKQSGREIWRTAVYCRALAIVGNDPVTAQNAAEIAAQYTPRKTFTESERRQIHAKALRMVAGFTPSSSASQRDAKFAKLGARLDKLRARTTARGFTPSEAKAARQRVFDILRSNQCHDTGLTSSELEQFRLWYSRRDG